MDQLTETKRLPLLASDWFTGEHQHILCPICEDENVHHECRAVVARGEDGYKAHPHVRGDVIAIPMYCENGHHQFTLFLGFHKGFTLAWCEKTGEDPDYWMKICAGEDAKLKK